MAKTTNKSTLILGLMSGTSLDGLDMALCEFKQQGKDFNFSIINAKTISYAAKWKEKLESAKNAGAAEYFRFNAEYGDFIATQVNLFLKKQARKPAAIASHGHTVFHQPQNGFTTQVGCGAHIAAKTGITTVCDFRSLDVALNGQGAPLVPIGDRLLFANYDACLNIGGIANISFEKGDRRIAYDICEANMLLNILAGRLGLAYDKDGKIAGSGNVNTQLLKQLSSQSYYAKRGAKSLGREWFEANSLRIIDKSRLPAKDLLATATSHIANIIARDLEKNRIKKVLVTGGGAFNRQLITLIKSATSCEVIIPSAEVVNFKEALIFAFLGYLRLSEKVNTLKSVTGAKRNSIGGAVYLG